MSGGHATSAELASLNQFATKANDAAGQIQQTLSSMESNLSTLIASYKGAGGDAFRATVTVVNEEMTRLHQALTYLSGHVSTAARNYQAADDAQQTELRKSGTEMSGLAAKLGV
jgi:WXG100 family type VII secretion target